MTNEAEVLEKRKYAALLFKEGDAFKAALLMFPQDTSRAFWIANNWVNDDEVNAEKNRIVKSGKDIDFLPTKAEFARELLQRMRRCDDDGKYASIAKIYAEVRQFIEKPQTNVNVNAVSRVIEVPAFRDESEWEAKTASDQRELLKNARNRH
jgi:hypothetical protein